MKALSQATIFLAQCVHNAQVWFRSSTNFLGKIAHANTADRTYTFPDKSGTVAMTSDITTSSTDFTQAFMFMGG